jgi:hypothetical protein
MLCSMDAIAASGGTEGAESSQALLMLKKTQDLMKTESALLLEALPEPPRSPSPPGVGGAVDILA